MKKFSLLLLFVAALFVVMGQGCRKNDPIIDDNPPVVVPPPGGGTTNPPDTVSKFGSIKIRVAHGVRTAQAYPDAEVSVALNRDSLTRKIYLETKLTDGQGYVTFSRMRIGKLYHFHAQLTDQNGDFLTGDTSARVNSETITFNTNIKMK